MIRYCDAFHTGSHWGYITTLYPQKSVLTDDEGHGFKENQKEISSVIVSYSTKYRL